MVILSGVAFAGAVSCAGGEDVNLFENAGGKGGSGGHAGSSSGSSGSTANGGASGNGQAGSAQGGSAQGGAGQGGSAQAGSAGTAMGGSSGAAGNAGSANTDASMPDVVTTNCNMLALIGTPVSGQGVTLQYQNTNADVADASIAFNLELTASTTLALNELEVRYFFTNELTTPSTLELYYAGAGNSGRDITAKIVKKLVPAALGAGIDAYLSYTINDTGSVTSGEKIKINPAFHSSDYQQKLNECNDYSFDQSATSMKDNPRIAVYRNGLLIWGAAPGGLATEGGTDAAPSDASVEGASSDAPADSPIDQSAPETATDAATEAAGD
jgi:hypothetical protein